MVTWLKNRPGTVKGLHSEYIIDAILSPLIAWTLYNVCVQLFYIAYGYMKDGYQTQTLHGSHEGVILWAYKRCNSQSNIAWTSNSVCAQCFYIVYGHIRDGYQKQKQDWSREGVTIWANHGCNSQFCFDWTLCNICVQCLYIAYGHFKHGYLTQNSLGTDGLPSMRIIIDAILSTLQPGLYAMYMFSAYV